ncbi:MAG: peroxiredoxin [Thermoplasmata archaeon]
MSLKTGDIAPEFELPDYTLKMRKLSEYLGNKTVLAFFPGAFTSVCTKELCAFRDSLSNLNRLNAKVVGISVDPPFSQAAFAKENRLNFDLLSDFSKEVSKKYDVLHNDFAGIKGLQASKRSIFILDAKGIIKYIWISEDPGKEPDYKKIEGELSKF